MLILLAEYLSMRLLVILLVLMVVRGMAQGPEVRVLGGLHHKWYHSYLRFLPGEEGHSYLIRTREGSYWGSSQEGERSYEILRLDANMEDAGNFTMKAGGNGSPLINTFEFVPTPEGLAIVGAVRTETRPGTALAICRPYFYPDMHGPGHKVSWTCTNLVPLPDHIPGISKTRLRMAWAADSSCVVLTWRQVANSEGPDNPAGCIVLDRNLRPLTPQLTPLSHVQAVVGILGLGITDPGHIYFHLRVFDGKGLLQTPQSVGAVLAEYEVATQTLHPIRLGGGRFPLDVRFLPQAGGQTRVVGTYLGPVELERSVGLFSGMIGATDSLDAVSFSPFDKELRDEIVLDQSKNGVTTVMRPLGHTALVRVGDGWIYAMQLRGQASHPQAHRLIGRDHNQTLIAWPLDSALQPGAPVRWAFLQESRTDYLETFSWMPVMLRGEAYGLVTDYAAVEKLGKPGLAMAWLLPLDGDGPALKAYTPVAQDHPTVLAPRHGFKLGPGTYRFLARSHKHLHILELRWRE